MQRITNIYMLIDTSLYMKANAEKVQSILVKTERVLAFIPQKTRLHIWGYNDEARLIGTNGRIITHGNPNLAEGLKAIKMPCFMRENTHHIGHGLYSLFIRRERLSWGGSLRLVSSLSSVSLHSGIDTQ